MQAPSIKEQCHCAFRGTVTTCNYDNHHQYYKTVYLQEVIMYSIYKIYKCVSIHYIQYILPYTYITYRMYNIQMRILDKKYFNVLSNGSNNIALFQTWTEIQVLLNVQFSNCIWWKQDQHVYLKKENLLHIQLSQNTLN